MFILDSDGQKESFLAIYLLCVIIILLSSVDRVNVLASKTEQGFNIGNVQDEPITMSELLHQAKHR